MEAPLGYNVVVVKVIYERDLRRRRQVLVDRFHLYLVPGGPVCGDSGVPYHDRRRKPGFATPSGVAGGGHLVCHQRPDSDIRTITVEIEPGPGTSLLGDLRACNMSMPMSSRIIPPAMPSLRLFLTLSWQEPIGCGVTLAIREFAS